MIIPAHNEETALPQVLRELNASLRATAPAHRFVIAVGANACGDATAEVARQAGALVGVTPRAGYGHGCHAAWQALPRGDQPFDALLFMAGDGANDPADIPRLLQAYADGYDCVLGTRTPRPANYACPWDNRRLANLVLGAYCWMLSGFRQFFTDLGPFRLIDRRLYERLGMCEFTWGWTIEAQLKAALLGASIREVQVSERPRIGGQQKVSGVSTRHTLKVGTHIFAAGRRVARAHRLRRYEVPAMVEDAHPAASVRVLTDANSTDFVNGSQPAPRSQRKKTA